MILAEYRNTIWSTKSDTRTFEVGATIADMLAQFDLPPEFEYFGGVYLKRDRIDPGHVIPREVWHRVRPKQEAMLFVSLIPRGGGDGGGGTGKTAFAAVAAVALIALSYGTASFLAPLGFLGAVVQAGVAVCGEIELHVLTGREISTRLIHRWPDINGERIRL